MSNDTQLIVVSQGARGALAGYGGTFYRIQIPQVNAINPVGSGDSMMAGLVSALHRGQDIVEVLKRGAACGTANTLHTMAGKVTMQEIESIYKDIQIIPI